MIEEQITELMLSRLDQWLREAAEAAPDAISEVYVAAFWKNSFAYVDYIDLHFTWNLTRAWEEHSQRPSNRELPAEAKWRQEEWAWYENCPHQRHHSVTLFQGEPPSETDDRARFETDRSFQAEFLAPHPGNRKAQHLAFVERCGTPLVETFRTHSVCQSAGISKIPLLFFVPDCPSYGEEYRDLCSSWNPDGFPEGCRY